MRTLFIAALAWWIATIGASAQSAEPASPEQPFTLVGLLHDDRALNRPHDVELQGDVAYVPGKGGSLAVIDVADPANPRLLASMVDPGGLADAETVMPMGDILLLGTRDFVAIDVSNPRRPVIKKSISDRPRIDRINGMARRGKHVFTANKSGYVSVFDIGDPAEPRLVGVLDAKAKGGMKSPHDIAVFGDRILVVNAAHHGPVHLCVYRVADAKTGKLLPASKWIIEGSICSDGQTPDHLGGANRVAVAGHIACVGAYVRDRVALVDLSNPQKLAMLANLPVADRDATGMTIAGNVLFVAGGECIEAIDISNPQRPVSLAQYRAGRLFPTRKFMLKGEARYDNAHDLVYRNGYLYATAQNDNHFGILKVNDARVLRLARSAPSKPDE